MTRIEAFELVRAWTKDELRYVQYADKGGAQKACEAYSLVLECPCEVREHFDDVTNQSTFWVHVPLD